MPCHHRVLSKTMEMIFWRSPLVPLALFWPWHDIAPILGLSAIWIPLLQVPCQSPCWLRQEVQYSWKIWMGNHIMGAWKKTLLWEQNELRQNGSNESNTFPITEASLIFRARWYKLIPHDCAVLDKNETFAFSTNQTKKSAAPQRRSGMIWTWRTPNRSHNENTVLQTLER